MPENTPATPAAPAPKKHKTPGPIDSGLVAQLRLDQGIIDSAHDEMSTDPTFVTALSTHFLDRENTIAITPASLATLSTQAGSALAASGAITAAQAALDNVTDDEGNDAKTAIAAIRAVQGAAKEKYEESAPARLGAYFIGHRLHSRDDISTAGTAAYQQLRTTDASGNPVTPQDTLPGFTQPRIDQLKIDLGSYLTIETEQSGAQKDTTDARNAFANDCAQVSRRRRKLQLAVDVERPYSNPANTMLPALTHGFVQRHLEAAA